MPKLGISNAWNPGILGCHLSVLADQEQLSSDQTVIGTFAHAHLSMMPEGTKQKKRKYYFSINLLQQWSYKFKFECISG